VDAAPASSWLAGQLASPAADGVLTVIWHSITRQYWPLAEITAVESVLVEARSRMPIAHIAMESPVSAADVSDQPGHRPAELTVGLSVPGRTADPAPRLLGTVGDHGVPVRLG